MLRFFIIFMCLALPDLGLAQPMHGIAMHGDPALPRDFSHFRYVNPQAPKGGRIITGQSGSFDSLNPFIIRGTAPAGLRAAVFETLLTRHYDEPFSLYGLVAESVETPPDRSWVVFHLNPLARFSDGVAITAEDVRFSFELLKSKGRPNHRGFYSKVKAVHLMGERAIRFDLGSGGDRELPLILGLMPILPRHAIQPETFEETGMKHFPGSGPYRVEEAKAGEYVVLKRRADYWGKELPVHRGQFNVDELRLEFYRDSTTLFEAFRKGLIDYRVETDPALWRSGYDFPAFRDGRVIKTAISTKTPKGFAAFAMNARREMFKDPRIREALTLLFDFEWTNKTYYAGLYSRTASIFEGSELSSRTKAATASEMTLLTHVGAKLRDDMAKGTFRLPVTDGSGQDRTSLRQALTLLEAAGYQLTNGRLVNKANGQALSFEILCATREQERLALAYVRQLSRAGIKVMIRSVDATQYDQRMRHYDFDMTQTTWWTTSLSPGNEQAVYWGSEAGKSPGSRNITGINDPAIDRLIDALVAANSREELVTAARALDRTVMSGFYAVPLFHLPEQWIARWNHVRMPDESSAFGYLPETWWVSPDK